jgi:hypothetical protein
MGRVEENVRLGLMRVLGEWEWVRAREERNVVRMCV